MKYILLASLLFLFSCNEKTVSDTKETSDSEEKNMLTAQLEYEIPSQLGEGAFWNHQSNEFWWVDIEGKQLHIYDPETKTNRSFEMPSRVGTVVPQTDSTAVVALEDGIYVKNINSGELTLLNDVESDIPTNRFNDGKCDPNGNLWVGSMRLDETIPAASLYRISPQGEEVKMRGSITISNGIVWSRDSKTMYYIDTPTGVIRAYDFDPTTNTISNERVAVTVPESLGYPDGMAIDSEDNLWVGLWNGNAVARFDPETGKLIEKIRVPAHNVTACAFGGPDLDILYITTASVDMTDEEKAAYPLAGSLFKIKPGVKGVKSCFFGTVDQ